MPVLPNAVTGPPAIVSATSTGPVSPARAGGPTITSPIAILLSSHLAEEGRGRNVLAERARGPRASLLRLRRGAYVALRDWQALHGDQRHLVRVCASLLTGGPGRPDAALGHESAAVVHGLPLVGLLPDKVTYVLPDASGTRTTRVTRVLPVRQDVEVVMVRGVLVTTVAQTLVDLARRRSLASNLASIDDALRRGLVTKEELVTRIEAQAGCHGNARARRMVALADPRSESVGESLSRAVMIAARLPPPDLQVRVIGENGIVVGRVDFMWPDLRVAGEFDGKGKYRRHERGAETAMTDERLRENHLEVMGRLTVVRWDWDDAYTDQGRGMLMFLRAAGVHALH